MIHLDAYFMHQDQPTLIAIWTMENQGRHPGINEETSARVAGGICSIHLSSRKGDSVSGGVSHHVSLSVYRSLADLGWRVGTMRCTGGGPIVTCCKNSSVNTRDRSDVEAGAG